MPSIDSLKNLLSRYEPLQTLPEQLDLHRRLTLRGVPGMLKAYAVSRLVESGKRVLWIASRSVLREVAFADLNQLLPDDEVGLLPAPDSKDDITPFEIRIFRARALQHWTSPRPYVLVTEPSSTWLKLLPHKEALDRIRIHLETNMDLGRDLLAERLADAGYLRCDVVENRGEYAIRGHILDLFSFTEDKPLRIEYWGNNIESLRNFDPLTQRTIKHLKRSNLFLSRLNEDSGTSLQEYMTEDDVLFIEEPEDIAIAARDANTETEWQNLFAGRKVLYWGNPNKDVKSLDIRGIPQDDFGGNIKRFSQSLAENTSNKAYISFESDGQLDRLRQLLEDREVDPLPNLIVSQLSGGYQLPKNGPTLYTDHQIFKRARRRRSYFRLRNFSPIERAATLKKGDFVVHTDFGIGRYLGLKNIQVGGHTRECLHIEYKGNTTLYIRLESLKKVQKFSGREGFIPPLTRIGGGEWDKIRRRARKAVQELAGDLVKLYARRSTNDGFAFEKDDSMQIELETRFEFAETPDQMKAIDDVKSDMEVNKPMDRLVCGDVGYGKTEVALRAAFKAVISGKQVCVLVPTTLLAQQHLQTFNQRLLDSPIHIEMLSRFRTKRQQTEIIEKLKDGQIDIIIGTHRILSKDVQFKNLGLLIVDEEHRFGVTHKERIKSLRSKIDALTLTATPIPRTLHMALIGARDMSLIQTAPQDRLPIETEIAPFSQDLITEVILHELDRDGQIYFVHNRVQSINTIREMLERWLPQVRFVVAHGQMPEKQLEKTMSEFLNRKYDCLISTMIIESGLDLPNVNTMIVNRADRFGLAQLYQLRGRIGRSNRQAYAFLLTPPNLTLTDPSRKRLDAIRYCSYLGAGYQIAMHDLEIRGAGEVFGARQSGFIHAVGFDLYQKMLAKSIDELKEDANINHDKKMVKSAELEPKIEFPFDAYLPDNYIEGAEQRLEIYRRLSGERSISSLHNIIEETIDRYGSPPKQAQALFNLIELKLGCILSGIPKLELHKDYLLAEIIHQNDGDWHRSLNRIVEKWDDEPIEFSGNDPPKILIRWDSTEHWDDRITYTKNILQQLA